MDILLSIGVALLGVAAFVLVYWAAKREQEARRDSDEWEQVISPYLLGKSEVTVGEILARCLNIEQDRWDKPIQMRVARVLKALDWKKKTTWKSGRATKTWIYLP